MRHTSIQWDTRIRNKYPTWNITQAIENIHRYKLIRWGFSWLVWHWITISLLFTDYQGFVAFGKLTVHILCICMFISLSLYLCIVSIVCIIFQLGYLFLVQMSHYIEVCLIFCIDLTFNNLVKLFYYTILNSLDFFKTIILSTKNTSLLLLLPIFLTFSCLITLDETSSVTLDGTLRANISN